LKGISVSKQSSNLKNLNIVDKRCHFKSSFSNFFLNNYFPYRAKGVVYLGEMSIENTHACMKDSTALVNTSESEGMAAVVLEVGYSLLHTK
jgi:hypothetical protein